MGLAMLVKKSHLNADQQEVAVIFGCLAVVESTT